MDYKLCELIEKVEGLEVLSGSGEVMIKDGYVSDLLSDVMRNAAEGSIWITVQHHENVVAVALMADIAAVVFSNDLEPGEEVVQRARKEGLTLCTFPDTSFKLVGELYGLGVGQKNANEA